MTGGGFCGCLLRLIGLPGSFHGGGFWLFTFVVDVSLRWVVCLKGGGVTTQPGLPRPLLSVLFVFHS